MTVSVEIHCGCVRVQNPAALRFEDQDGIGFHFEKSPVALLAFA